APIGPLVFTRKKYRWNDFAVNAHAPLIVDMKSTFHSGHLAETASASDDSATPVRNFTPSFSTSFCALRTAAPGSPAVSSKMNSTGRPRLPLALTSFENRSAARLAWVPYWA